MFCDQCGTELETGQKFCSPIRDSMGVYTLSVLLPSHSEAEYEKILARWRGVSNLKCRKLEWPPDQGGHFSDYRAEKTITAW